MRRFRLAPLFFTAAIAIPACAADNPETASKELSAALDRVSNVTLYFVSRTGEYSYDPATMRSKSSIRIYRSCGGNCDIVMDEVIQHLKASKSIECLDQKQQNVLMDIGDSEVVEYSYSGRAIRFRNRCYFNNRGITDVIRASTFPFGY